MCEELKAENAQIKATCRFFDMIIKDTVHTYVDGREVDRGYVAKAEDVRYGGLDTIIETEGLHGYHFVSYPILHTKKYYNERKGNVNED